LPICWRPFAEIAKALNSNESHVLQQSNELSGLGIIRRISAVVNYRALGITSTLVAAHVPQKNIKEVVAAINALKGVSHNYLRNHHYNLWFTLQAETTEQIGTMLLNLSGQLGIDFHNMPVKQVFKLDVRFNAESQGQALLRDVNDIPKDGNVRLNKNQKLVLSKLQNDLALVVKPFEFICTDVLNEEDVINIITDLVDMGLIRRIAGIVDHRKLGFSANVLFACEVPQDKIAVVGTRLANLSIVSHCYERQKFKGWSYNLFAMMHGRSMGDIQRVIAKFTKAEAIESFLLLPTATELKKHPVKQQF
jgi:DNA-binding Lrp family transcriptional regulator